jgi:hypothetical protein
MNRFIFCTCLKWRDAVARHLFVTAVLFALVTALTAQQSPEIQSAQWICGSFGPANLILCQNQTSTKSVEGTPLWNAGEVAGSRILRNGGISFKKCAGGISRFAEQLNLIDSNKLKTDINHVIWLLLNNTAQVYHGTHQASVPELSLLTSLRPNEF